MSHLILSSLVYWELQDEDIWAIWLCRPEYGANGWLPRSAWAFPHPWHLICQCYGGLLDSTWTPTLQGTPVLLAPWRVQETQWVGKQQSHHWISETCHWYQLISSSPFLPLPSLIVKLPTLLFFKCLHCFSVVSTLCCGVQTWNHTFWWWLWCVWCWVLVLLVCFTLLGKSCSSTQAMLTVNMIFFALVVL